MPLALTYTPDEDAERRIIECLGGETSADEQASLAAFVFARA